MAVNEITNTGVELALDEFNRTGLDLKRVPGRIMAVDRTIRGDDLPVPGGAIQALVPIGGCGRMAGERFESQERESGPFRGKFHRAVTYTELGTSWTLRNEERFRPLPGSWC